MFPHFQKYRNPQVLFGSNRKIGKQCFLPPLSFKIILNDTSFYISLNSLGFCLSRMLFEFSLICVFQHMWEKFFNLWCSHSQKITESMLFYSCPSLPLKSPGKNFWKSISPKTEGVEEAMICFIKTQSQNMKMTWNTSIFPFGLFPCNFSKYDGFTIL